MMQVLGAVQIVIGVIAFLAAAAILIVLLVRGEQVGYSVVIVMVILVSTVPVGGFLAFSSIQIIFHQIPPDRRCVFMYSRLTFLFVGMPVVTTTVLAVGAREMAREKAIVNR